MSHPSDLKYTESHEFVKILDDNKIRIGITHHAQSQLGDITYVELPEVDVEYSKGDSFGVIESVKAVSDLYIPLSGKVLEVNSALEDSPELINEDPYEKGWIAVVELSDPSELDGLMTNEEYEKQL